MPWSLFYKAARYSTVSLGCDKKEQARTEEDNCYVDRAENTKLISFLEETILALRVGGVKKE